MITPEIKDIPEDLLLALRYEGGRIYWLIDRCNKSVKAGSEAGNISIQGYRVISHHKISYNVHRVVWTMHHGQIPSGMYVDHINGDRSDNRIENLRLVTCALNQYNSTVRAGTSSRYKGVTWHNRDNKWQASIKGAGKSKHLGYFLDEEDAARAYDAAAIDLFGEYARLNFPVRPLPSPPEAPSKKGEA